MDDNQPIIKTEFNASIAKLKRIDELHQLSHKMRIENNQIAWYDVLMCYRSELWEKMNADERTKVNNDAAAMTQHLQVYRDLIDKLTQDPEAQVTFGTELYTALDNFERFLFDIENKYELGI